MSGYIKKKDVVPLLDSYYVIWYECNEYQNIALEESDVRVKDNSILVKSFNYDVDFNYVDDTKTTIENGDGVTLYENKVDAIIDYISLSKNIATYFKDRRDNYNDRLASITNDVNQFNVELERITNIDKLVDKL